MNNVEFLVNMPRTEMIKNHGVLYWYSRADVAEARVEVLQERIIELEKKLDELGENKCVTCTYEKDCADLAIGRECGCVDAEAYVEESK